MNAQLNLRTGIFIVVTLAVIACRQSLPAPTYPLVSSSATEVPEPPPVGRVSPPEFPAPEVSKIEDGPTLWVVRNPNLRDANVTITAQRGDDGAYPHPVFSVALGLMEDELERYLPSANTNRSLTIHGASLRANVPVVDVGGAIQAMGHVLTDYESSSDEHYEKYIFNRVQALDGMEHSGPGSAWLGTLDHRAGGEARLGWAHRPIMEQLEALEQSTAQDCRKERFSPDELLVTVIGDVEPVKVRDMFQHVFREFTGHRERIAAQPATGRPARGALSRATHSERVHVLFTQHAPPLEHPDRFKFELLVKLLGGVFSSGLNALREQHAYTYGAFGYISSGRLRDLLVVRANFEPEQVQPALEEFFGQLNGFRTALNESDLELGRQQIWTNLQAQVDGLNYQTILAEAWALQLSVQELQARYAALAEVTPDELQRIAQEQLDPRDGLLVLTGDFENVHGFTVRRDSTGFRLEE